MSTTFLKDHICASKHCEICGQCFQQYIDWAQHDCEPEEEVLLKTVNCELCTFSKDRWDKIQYYRRKILVCLNLI